MQKALTMIEDLDRMGIGVNASEEYLDLSIPQNKLMLTIYLTNGEVERHLISARTASGIYQAKKDGYFTGKAPYGYMNVRDEFKKSTLKPNENAHFITKAFKEVAMGLEPMEVIRKRLYIDGMRLERSAFGDVLKNIVYAGKIVVPEYKKEPEMIVKGKHEPLIDMDTFYKVNAIFNSGKWHNMKPAHKHIDFPLRDFFECKECSHQITGSISKGRSKRYKYYHCRHQCKTRISVDEAHDRVANLLGSIKINPNVKELFGKILVDSQSAINGNKKMDLKHKAERKKFLITNIEKAEDMLLAGTIEPSMYKNIVNRYNSELMSINNELEVLSTEKTSIKEYIDGGLEMLTNLDKLFDSADYDGKRLIAGSIFTKKLILGNDNCRTAGVNEVIEVLTRNSKAFGRAKKEKATISGDFSAWVPGAGVEPAYQ